MTMERLLAGFLRYGAISASLCISIGLLVPWESLNLVAIGVAMFILLPVLRVALMIGIFLKEKDFRFAAISAVVLAIIVSGFTWGATHS